MFASVIGAAGWQYARRRTWHSRSLLLGGLLLTLLIAVVTPYASFVNRRYPLVMPKDSPAQIVFGRFSAPSKKRPDWLLRLPEMALQIPLKTSGVGSGKVALIHGSRLTLSTPIGQSWDSTWRSQWIPLWPEGGDAELCFNINRKKYDEMLSRNVRVHLELLLTEYEETRPWEVVWDESNFKDPELGLCSFFMWPPKESSVSVPSAIQV